MIEIFTQCPYCQTSFSISEAHLTVADGIVRCGSCFEIFSARDYMAVPPEPAPKEIDQEASKANPKTEFQQNLMDLESEESLETLQPETIASIQEEPIALSQRTSADKYQRKLLPALCFLLFTLAGQYVWFNFNDPHMRPVATVLCRALTCQETEEFNPEMFVTEEIIVRSHPDQTNALQVDFIFSNSATVEQDFPLAALKFTDTRGLLLAERLFTPQEYLPLGLRDLAKMPAGARIQTYLEIVDPGQGAINYALEFK